MEGTIYMEDESIAEVVDSDKEEEEKEFEKNQFELEFELDESKVSQGSKVVVYSAKCAQALIRILHNDDLTQIGKVTAKVKDEKNKECLKIFSAGNLVVLQDEGVSGGYCGQILAKLWPVFTAKGCLVVGLSSVYKRNYGTEDGSIEIDSEQILPLKFIRSSHANPALDKF